VRRRRNRRKGLMRLLGRNKLLETPFPERERENERERERERKRERERER
jgi:hypothetical protein